MVRECRWLLMLALSSAAWAQAKMEFDVASIRQNKAGFPPAGPMPKSNFPLGPGAMYTPSHGELSVTNEPLSVYIMFAYKLDDLGALEKQLPAWALAEHYDVEARTDKRDATKDEMRLMMQALLADRFKLALHRTSEEVPVFALVLAKPGKLGPKLRAHPEDGPACVAATPDAAGQTVPGGFPAICGGSAFVRPSVPGRMSVGYRDVSLALVAQQMMNFGGLERPVVDRTGLTGKFDLVLEWAREFGRDGELVASVEMNGLPFERALAEQNGLKLVAAKGSVEVVAVDHIERPTAN